MGKSVIVVGAGIIGAAVAYRLSAGGARVMLLDGSGIAAGASGRSFGWINASFFVDDAHHALRVAGLAAWRRLGQDLPGLALEWKPALWWEEQGAGLDRMEDDLRARGYPVDRLGQSELLRLEPALARAPDTALCFRAEGVAEAARVTRQIVEAATAQGVRVVLGSEVTGLTQHGGRVIGVQTNQGSLEADEVVLATGVGTPRLLAELGLILRLPDRPGLMLRTVPVPPVLHHVLVTTDGEVRQDSAGRLVLPAAINHQADQAERLADRPDRVADSALERLRALLKVEISGWSEATLANRPVPPDGLPLVGRPGPEGLYLAVMHSGVTLAALMGEAIAQEVLTSDPVPALAPYRPEGRMG